MFRTLEPEQESRGEELLKQNQSIFSKVKEKLMDINKTHQMLQSNLKNIKEPLSETDINKQSSQVIDYSFSQKGFDLTDKLLKYRLQDMSFSEDLLVKPTEQIINFTEQQPQKHRTYTFIPFNKLYRSTVMQLKGKNKVILARRYKGNSVPANQGRITDGKIYKLNNIVTDEEELLRNLCTRETEVICFAGPKSTLKKKLLMCLLIKEYQRLSELISDTIVSKLQIHYSEIHDRMLGKDEQERMQINNDTRHMSLIKLSSIFQGLLEMASQKNKQKTYKNRTRICRIIFASEKCKHLVELISTNNLDPTFLLELKPDTVVWCINPLVKNYEGTQLTLDSMHHYEKKVILKN